jgi:hypothetical protein
VAASSSDVHAGNDLGDRAAPLSGTQLCGWCADGARVAGEGRRGGRWPRRGQPRQLSVAGVIVLTKDAIQTAKNADLVFRAASYAELQGEIDDHQVDATKLFYLAQEVETLRNKMT